MSSKKQLIVQKCIPSLLLFIAGFVIGFILFESYGLSERIGKSFLVGWLAGGTIWGWSLTKKWFPNFRWFRNTKSSSSSMDAFASAVHTVGISFRIVTAFAVGAVALPVSVIIAIVTTVKVGKEAYDKVMKEEADKNSQKNQTTE